MTGLPLSIAEPLELIARSRAGDADAFTALVSAYQSRVFRWALALTGDQDEAEDVTQEVFVRVYRKLSSFRGDGPLDAWLYRITRRVALRVRRIAFPAVEESHDVYITDPGIRVDRQRALDLVRTIAATLPMRQREVFMLCDLEGRAPAEAAAILDMKDVSVRASLFKARASIRRRILATHPFYGEESS
ncbi:MAG TPA: RNA polymerase sigma factor [Gemmatimonadaceae bacterium]